jgi:hypothetical protein
MQIARQLVMVPLKHKDMQHSPSKNMLYQNLKFNTAKKKKPAIGLLMPFELQELNIIINSEQV